MRLGRLAFRQTSALGFSGVPMRLAYHCDLPPRHAASCKLPRVFYGLGFQVVILSGAKNLASAVCFLPRQAATLQLQMPWPFCHHLCRC